MRPHPDYQHLYEDLRIEAVGVVAGLRVVVEALDPKDWPGTRRAGLESLDRLKRELDRFRRPDQGSRGC